MTKFLKLKLHLRGWLTGAACFKPEFNKVLRAMDLAEKTHTGMRKDGYTPEFQHQIEIAQYLRTLIGCMQYPAETLAVVLLHDIVEDYSQSVTLADIRREFGDLVADAVWKITKKTADLKKNTESYFKDMALCPITSLAKGGDRVHNMQTMIGVFTPEKQLAYAEEVETYFLPMLKAARRNFPEQESAYENIKHVLTSQVQFVRAMHAGTSKGE